MSTLCLSQPGASSLLAEWLACTAGQGYGSRITSLHHAQRDSSLSRWLAAPDKACIHTFTLSTRLKLSPRQVDGSHRRTMLWSTLRLSQPDSACLLGESWPRTTGQGLYPRFASLHQAQRLSSPSRGLTPQDKAWIHAYPLSSKLGASPYHVAGLNRRTRLKSSLCLSPGSACLVAESWARTAGQGLGPRFDSLHIARPISMPSRWLASKNKAWVHALPLSSKLSASP